MILRSCLFFLFAIFCVFSQGAEARDFNAYADRTVLFEDCSKPQQDWIRWIIKTGLYRLDRINHHVLANRLKANPNRKAKFICSRDPHMRTDFIAETDRYFADDPALGLTQTASIKVAGCFAKPVDQFPAEILIFHEFLHFLVFDNLLPSVHNNPAAMNEPEVTKYAPKGQITYETLGQMLDAVYSCSLASFPEKSQVYEKLYDGIWKLELSEKACQSAFINRSNQVDIDVKSLPVFGGDHSIDSSAACLLTNRTPWSKDDPRPHVPSWTKELREKCAI